MVQQQMKLEGQLAGCPSCQRQPKHYYVYGKGLHLLECAPCGLRTAKMPTLQQAVEAWEGNQHVTTLKAS